MKTKAHSKPEIQSSKLGRFRPASVDARKNGAKGAQFQAASIVLALPLLLLLLNAPFAATAQNGIPKAINYQGKLTDNLGNPISSGSYNVAFRIWDHPTLAGNGNYIWGRSFPVHVVSNGLFNVLLTDEGGLVTTPATPKTTDMLTAFDGADRYLGLTIVPSSTEISPRQRLATAPYAIRAWSAAIAGNLVNSENQVVMSIVGTNIGINKPTAGTSLDVAGTVMATTFSGSGSGLTSLNANNLSSGTVPDARLSANVPKLNAANSSFTGNMTVGGNMQIGTHSGDYQHLQIGGGNSWGYLYGSWPTPGDGMHLGYNYYHDETGQGHIFNAGGGSSRLSVGYGQISLGTGPVNTAPSTRLFVNDVGNVGIGTTTPGFPLSFTNVLGDKISLWGQSGNHYGIGIQANTLQIHGDATSSKIVFGYGQSTNLIETMRIQGNGNVGILTTTPAATLDVNGTVKIKSHAPFMIRRYKGLVEATTDGVNNTTVSTTDYSAAVVGLHTSGGFHDLGTGALIQVLMRQVGGTWRIWVSIRADELSDIWVDVMFIRKELTDDNRPDF